MLRVWFRKLCLAAALSEYRVPVCWRRTRFNLALYERRQRVWRDRLLVGEWPDALHHGRGRSNKASRTRSAIRRSGYTEDDLRKPAARIPDRVSRRALAAVFEGSS